MIPLSKRRALHAHRLKLRTPTRSIPFNGDASSLLTSSTRLRFVNVFLLTIMIFFALFSAAAVNLDATSAAGRFFSFEVRSSVSAILSRGSEVVGFNRGTTAAVVEGPAIVLVEEGLFATPSEGPAVVVSLSEQDPEEEPKHEPIAQEPKHEPIAQEPMHEPTADPNPVCPWSSVSAQNLSDTITWSITGDLSVAPAAEGTAHLHIKGCDLSWTPVAARQCLRKLGHVVMVGDSITRLQYISLVHWLHTGSWSPKDGRPPGDSPRHWAHPSGGEKTEINWVDYFQTLADRLGGAEICDCIISNIHIENRYYAFGGLRLTYLSAYKYLSPVVLHKSAWLNVSCGHTSCQQSGCAPGRCFETSQQTTVGTSEFLRSVPRTLEPDVLVLNLGAHMDITERELPEHLEQTRAIALEMSSVTAAGPRAAGAREREREGGGSGLKRGLIWKVTTPGKYQADETAKVWRSGKDNKNESERPGERKPPSRGVPFAPSGPWPIGGEEGNARVTREGGGRVFDTNALLYPLITALARADIAAGAFAHDADVFHFAPAINAEINKAMLSMLCEE